MSSNNRLVLTSPAKVNLYLGVLGKRSDGYHDLLTFMQKISLADEIFLEERREGIEIRCPESGLPEDEGNIAYRAARAVLAAAHSAKGVAITIKKKIPIAAGLGGGSSNAATVLKGIKKLLQLNLDGDELHSIARSLGADVPFFVGDWTAAWAEGIGDRLCPVDHQTLKWLVLVNPGFPLATKWVYENFKLTSSADTFILGRDQAIGSKRYPFLPDGEYPFVNELEAVTLTRFPELSAIKEKMMQFNADGTLLSGSGPTIFGVFSQKDRAEACAAAFLDHSASSVFLARFMMHSQQVGVGFKPALTPKR